MDEYTVGDSTSYAIAPEFGGNLCRWRMSGADILYSPPGFPNASMRVYDGGIPLMFPSVGRTWDRTAAQPVSDRYRIWDDSETRSMPIHGILPLCRWTKRAEALGACEVSATYELEVPPSIAAAHYPYAVSYLQTFVLTAESVEIHASLTNNGARTAPVAFGLHPYFRLSNSARIGVSIHLPCTHRVELDDELLVPTGKTTPLVGPFGFDHTASYDAAFSGMNGKQARLVDRNAGHEIAIEIDDSIEMFVLYAPLNASFVCIEPWTRGLGAYETLRDGHWTAGETIAALNAGETKSVSVRFVVTPLRDGD